MPNNSEDVIDVTPTSVPEPEGGKKNWFKGCGIVALLLLLMLLCIGALFGSYLYGTSRQAATTNEQQVQQAPATPTPDVVEQAPAPSSVNQEPLQVVTDVHSGTQTFNIKENECFWGSMDPGHIEWKGSSYEITGNGATFAACGPGTLIVSTPHQAHLVVQKGSVVDYGFDGKDTNYRW